MRVLITRPREDAETLAAILDKRGIDVLIEPLLEIRPLPDARLDLDGAQAVLLTSANGARILAGLTDRRDLRILAVGDATARLAREAGFAAVESAGGNVEHLARLATARLNPQNGRLVHIAGTDIAGDLSGLLTGRGFTVTRAALYEARPVSRLSPAAVGAIRKRTIDAALFFSPRTAAAFVSLARGADLAESCVNIDAICLSAAVSKALETSTWRSRRVAERPDQDSLLACLDRLQAERS